MNGRNSGEGGNHNYPGYVPITTQPTVVTGVVAKVSWPNGIPPPLGSYFEFPEQQQEYTQYQQY